MKLHPARMAICSEEGQAGCHCGVCYFGFHVSSRAVRLLPSLQTTAGSVDMSAERALIWFDLLGNHVVVVCFEFLGSFSIEVSFVLGHKCIPATVTHIVRCVGIVREIGLFRDQLRIDRKISADEITVLCAF